MINRLIKFQCIFFFIFSFSVIARYYSQFGQDKYLNEIIFKNKKNGFFVDIGAHNGIKLSNTKFFEDELGWNGICIEPSPKIFQKLEKNRKCICINACVSNETKKARFMFIDSLYDIATMYSGLVEKYDPRHLERIEEYFSQEEKKFINVQCYRLDDILDKYNISHIDYLSIDTEGGEFDILTSIDFEKVNIEIIDIENNYNENNIKEFLESKGYKFINRLVCDEIYQKVNG